MFVTDALLTCPWPAAYEAQVQLTCYLEANLLLIDCLNLARVSDRMGIEDDLLLPPVA